MEGSAQGGPAKRGPAKGNARRALELFGVLAAVGAWVFYGSALLDVLPDWPGLLLGISVVGLSVYATTQIDPSVPGDPRSWDELLGTRLLCAGTCTVMMGAPLGDPRLTILAGSIGIVLGGIGAFVKPR